MPRSGWCSAARRGTADPSRICTVSASYGGHAALMGGAGTPDTYRCGASLAGISDLLELARDRAHQVNRSEVFERKVASTWSGRQRLAGTSPRRLAERFRVPVLLVDGTLDLSVPFAQSQAMADALQAAGNPRRLAPLRDGDPYLSVAAHLLLFVRELEDFLPRQIGAGGETASR